ncbi:helix-turn-helix transcriptional regulator [Litoreibacter albidus]|uniref:Regulatory protein, luxR family n=1 Tax=Litoreibacter albidus TaxID=670155 RepID=A0A1H2QJK5_9RHOB|nr:helix-turn-helix transcriptional regulator [Litoreibacter albidus]SDW07397.1 regulatory protein, luxR family [Litoreibacter albidus]
MSRIWISGIGLIALVAALKTFIVVYFAIPSGAASLPIILGFYTLFFALTSLVAYVSFTQLRAYMGRQRKDRLAPGVSEPVAKETVILRYAPDWGLSQAEADVAIFVAKGFSNSEIADMRGCAIATVKSQLGKIYNKTGLDSRYQLIAFVTDEVLAMVNEPDDGRSQLNTRKMLPLSGRAKNAS